MIGMAVSRMANCLLVWNGWLSKRMFPFVLAAVLLGLFTPVSDSSLLKLPIIGLFAYMTFFTGLDTSLREFVKILRRPWLPLWILFLVHGLTPFLAWAVGWLVFPGDLNTRIGYLVGASIPVGATSIIWTAFTGGNVAVSLVTVTLDTLIAPVLLPLFFAALFGQTISVNYTQMAIQLLWMITIPSLAGMLLHDFTHGQLTIFSKTFGAFTSKLAFLGVVFFNAAVVAPIIAWNSALLKILLSSFFMVAAGYLIGFAGSFFIKNCPRATAIAMIYSVGLRNVASGLVLALACFPVRAAVPITLFMLYQQPLATIIPHLLKAVDHRGALEEEQATLLKK